METKFHAQREPFTGGINLSMMRKGKDEANRNMLVATDVKMEEMDRRICVSPFLQLAYEDAQRLMDELYHCGVRPTEAAGTAGSMKATQDHLQDMRCIVASKLSVKLKGATDDR